MPRDWLLRTSQKCPILCRLGRKTLISQLSLAEVSVHGCSSGGCGSESFRLQSEHLSEVHTSGWKSAFVFLAGVFNCKMKSCNGDSGTASYTWLGGKTDVRLATAFKTGHAAQCIGSCSDQWLIETDFQFPRRRAKHAFSCIHQSTVPPCIESGICVWAQRVSWGSNIEAAGEEERRPHNPSGHRVT